MADPSRRRILRYLEDADEPRDVQTLASGVGLHPNTVRGHLDLLEQADLVQRLVEKRETPGRPRMLYSALPHDHPTPSGNYRLLAEMLTTTLRVGSKTPTEAAEAAGKSWGLYLTDRSAPGRPPNYTEAISRITTLLDELGFEPEDGPRIGNETTVDLRDCPFRDLAKEHSDIVCSIHLGMLRGSAEALGEVVVVDSLQPFVDPSRCRTTMRPA
jgi:predicted ArsR family transcriptional regulator